MDVRETTRAMAAAADTREEQREAQAYAQDADYIHDDLQFKNKLITLESGKISPLMKRDLILSNLESSDLDLVRFMGETHFLFDYFGLGELNRVFNSPRFFMNVNSARARGGFEREALIKIKKDETAYIQQRTSGDSFLSKLRGRGK